MRGIKNSSQGPVLNQLEQSCHSLIRGRPEKEPGIEVKFGVILDLYFNSNKYLLIAYSVLSTVLNAGDKAMKTNKQINTKAFALMKV